MLDPSTVAHLDFEGFSLIDLGAAGVDRYASDCTKTGIWCFQYSIGEDEPKLWTPRDPEPTDLLDHIADGKPLVAHNAYFELTIHNELLRAPPQSHPDMPEFWRARPTCEHWPAINPEQLHCTMAMASSLALPSSLDDLAPAMGLTERKDKEGAAVMKRLMRPRSTKNGIVTWWDTDEEKLQRLYDYCRQDVIVEREVFKRLLPLPPSERELWLLHLKINKRGILVDIPVVQRAQQYVDWKKERMNERLADITGSIVTSVGQNKKLADWVDGQGVFCTSVAKDSVADMLARDNLPSDVREALDIKRLAGGTATTKLPAMLEAVSADNRARGTFGFHSASTGRFSSYRIQLHNLFRPVIEFREVERVIDAIRGANTDDILELCYGSPIDCVSSCLRSMLIASEGNELISADYNNIEGRTLAWLAGETWKINAFIAQDNKTGPEIYKMTAANILTLLGDGVRTPDSIDKGERQAYGKVPELALGFAGGFPAFQSMAKVYGVKVLDEHEDARPGWLSYEDVEAIKDAWREKHPRTRDFWYGLDKAAVMAVRNPGTLTGTNNGRVRFLVHKGFLFMRLPSGRRLAYYRPSIRTERGVSRKTGKTYEKSVVWYNGMDAVTRQFGEQRLSVMVLAENATSGTARDVLTDAMKRLERAGYPLVLHVHDEAVAEIPKGFGSEQEFEHIMCALEPWATGLPAFAAGAWRGLRYRKD